LFVLVVSSRTAFPTRVFGLGYFQIDVGGFRFIDLAMCRSARPEQSAGDVHGAVGAGGQCLAEVLDDVGSLSAFEIRSCRHVRQGSTAPGSWWWPLRGVCDSCRLMYCCQAPLTSGAKSRPSGGDWRLAGRMSCSTAFAAFESTPSRKIPRRR